MNPNRDDTVVRVHAFQRRFFQQDEIGNFPRLDGSELRIHFELPSVIDRGSSENLYQRHPGRLKRVATRLKRMNVNTVDY
jgi:hypothetical protein